VPWTRPPVPRTALSDGTGEPSLTPCHLQDRSILTTPLWIARLYSCQAAGLLVLALAGLSAPLGFPRQAAQAQADSQERRAPEQPKLQRRPGAFEGHHGCQPEERQAEGVAPPPVDAAHGEERQP